MSIHPAPRRFSILAMAALLCCLGVSTVMASDEQKAGGDGALGASVGELVEKVSGSIPGEAPISAAEVAAAQQFGQSLSIAEWLGPMAPVALSPFFGITCLSTLSIFGGDWIAKGNPLLGENSPMHNPAVFWTFLTLTILTSLPRLTKVSKPFAQAVDQLEAWSGIVTMLVMKFMLTEAGPDAEPAVVQAGLVEFSSETLLMLAAVINIFVINAVKFFFEVLIWLTPIPMLDALFEFCNKALCAALMALYAWSPTIATGLNLAMFAVALCVFGWMHRREIFFRHMLFGMLRTWFGSGAHQLPLLVFPTAAVGSIPARARCRLSKSSSGWTLTFQPLLKARRVVELPAANTPQMESGFLTNSIRFPSPAVELTFAKCSSESLSTLANQLQATISGQPSASRTNATARVEFGQRSTSELSSATGFTPVETGLCTTRISQFRCDRCSAQACKPPG